MKMHFAVVLNSLNALRQEFPENEIIKKVVDEATVELSSPQAVPFNEATAEQIVQTTGVLCSDPIQNFIVKTSDLAGDDLGIDPEWITEFINGYKRLYSVSGQYLFENEESRRQIIELVYQSVIYRFNGKFLLRRDVHIQGPVKHQIYLNGKADLVVEEQMEETSCVLIEAKGPWQVQGIRQVIAPAAIVYRETRNPVWAVYTNGTNWVFYIVDKNAAFKKGSIMSELDNVPEESELKSVLENMYRWIYYIVKNKCTL